MRSNLHIESKLKQASDNGIINPRTENNKSLKVSYKGAGKLISEKWNVKIYTSGSLVCNDSQTLQDIINDKLKSPDKTKKLLQIDDAGIGFPLCGIMVGVADGSKIHTDVVPASYFREGSFEKKLYLWEYTKKGYKIVTEIFDASPETHRIEICSGFINKKLKNFLRDQGYDVRIADIKGLLQDQLERLFKEYVKKETGADLAYDPKELGSKKLIAKGYKKALNWGRKNAPDLIKTGWRST